MPKRDSILFVDFDGTICFDRFWRSIEPSLYESIQKTLFVEQGDLVNEWMRGKHTAEDINRYLAEKLDIPYETLWEIFVADCSSMRVDTQVLDAIDALRDKYYTVLVTGNMDSFTRFTRPALRLDDYFDVIENSYERGILKDGEDGLVFKLYTEQYGVKVEDAYILDDSPQVCEVFTRIGGTACQVRGPEDTVRYLSELSLKSR